MLKRASLICLCIAALAAIVAMAVLISPASLGSEAAAARSIDLLSEQGMYDATLLWEREIRERGAAPAYSLLKTIYSADGLMVQHSASHAFGEALYTVEGASGLPVCDEELQYGCSHSMFGRAIEERGLDAARALFAHCHDTSERIASIFCAHGVGHGMIAHLGYDADALTQSLAMCEDLETQEMRGGCFSGTFMEYNLRDMQFTEGKNIRLWSADNVIEPCDTLTGDSERACYLSLPQWWRANLLKEGMEDMDAYRALGERCALFDRKKREVCFEGIGNIAPRAARFLTEGTLARCTAAQRTSHDEVICRASAASSFIAWGKPEEGKSLCEDLDAQARAYCLRYAGAFRLDKTR